LHGLRGKIHETRAGLNVANPFRVGKEEELVTLDGAADLRGILVGGQLWI